VEEAEEAEVIIVEEAEDVAEGVIRNLFLHTTKDPVDTVMKEMKF